MSDIPWDKPAKWEKQSGIASEGGIAPVTVGASCGSLRGAVEEAILHLKPHPNLVSVELADGSGRWVGEEIATLDAIRRR